MKKKSRMVAAAVFLGNFSPGLPLPWPLQKAVRVLMARRWVFASELIMERLGLRCSGWPEKLGPVGAAVEARLGRPIADCRKCPVVGLVLEWP